MISAPTSWDEVSRTVFWDRAVALSCWRAQVAAGHPSYLPASVHRMHPRVFARFYGRERFLRDWPALKAALSPEDWRAAGRFDLAWSHAMGGGWLVKPGPAFWSLPPKRRAFLLQVGRTPGISIYAAAQALGIPYRRAHDHAHALMALGFLRGGQQAMRPAMPSPCGGRLDTHRARRRWILWPDDPLQPTGGRMRNEEPIQVFLDIAGTPHPLGRLWLHDRRGQDSVSFQYEGAWLARAPKHAFPLDPALPLLPGVYHAAPIFGVFMDAAPNRWGRLLIQRAETAKRTLSASDYLLRVDDGLRMGALRFRIGNGPFLADGTSARVPPLTELPRLLAAAQRLDAGDDPREFEDIRLLLRPGSSLGGAHPKAVILDQDGSLWIAKFPSLHAEDRYRPHWEYVAIRLARRSGIRVPDCRLLHLTDHATVFLTRRFDRDARGHRIHYASAMTLLGAQDGDLRSYEEIAEALRERAVPAEDVRELWRRLVFSVLISNVDDHLRNHGVLWSPTDGFRLSPAFDINPAPPFHDRTLHGTTLRCGGSARLDFASVWAAAGDFLWAESGARAAIRQMVPVVSAWALEAKKARIPKAEQERWSGAFVHENFAAASDVARMSIMSRPKLD